MKLVLVSVIFLLGISDIRCQNLTSLLQPYQNTIYDYLRTTVLNSQEVGLGIPVTLKDIGFYLYTDTVQNVYIDPLRPANAANPEGTTVVLIHGYFSSRFNRGFPEVTRAFLGRPDTYVIQLSWALPSVDNYPSATFNAEVLGRLVGDLINRLVEDYDVPLSSFIVVGHSLGGHIAGFVGKRIISLRNATLPRIVALDPAGPLFLSRPAARRLNSTDADVVQAIHTNGGALGFFPPIGTIDFYPNGGMNQDGCITLDPFNAETYMGPLFCNHVRSLMYFAEAIREYQSFPSLKCENYTSFLEDKCWNNEIVYMGDLELRSTGKFYLTTNSQEPYSRGLGRNPTPRSNFFGFNYNFFNRTL